MFFVVVTVRIRPKFGNTEKFVNSIQFLVSFLILVTNEQIAVHLHSIVVKVEFNALDLLFRMTNNVE